jgi:hypothetical protein
MASRSEETPFLADNDHGDDYDEGESGFIKYTPANSHYRRPIRILSGVISFLSLSIFGVLIACYVLINVGPFQYTWGTREASRDLAIVVSTLLSYRPVKGASPALRKSTRLLSNLSYL